MRRSGRDVTQVSKICPPPPTNIYWTTPYVFAHPLGEGGVLRPKSLSENILKKLRPKTPLESQSLRFRGGKGLRS